MDPTAKLLGLVGFIFILLGGAWQLGWLQLLRIGRLPGDFYIDNENLKIYFPLTTGILISVLWALGAWLWRHL